MESFDYIIVGAGSAGCVLANRLTEDGTNSVLLLEYGGSDRSIYIQMPAALSIPMNRERNTTGSTRRSPSRISAAASCTRRAARFSAGRPPSTAWSMCAATPRTTRAGSNPARAAGATATCCPISVAPKRGRRAAIQLSRLGRAAPHLLRPDEEPALSRLDRGRETGGLPRDRGHQRLPAGGLRPDGHDRPSRPALERGQRLPQAGARPPEPGGADGVRSPAAILLEGRRAVGLRYRREGTETEVAARREVILCGGPINSPQLLKLSGIGPAAELREHGIDGRRRPAGRRREPAGPSRILFPDGGDPADHPVLGAVPRLQGA